MDEIAYAKFHLHSHNRLSRYLEAALFVDPGLMILLYLYVAKREDRTVTVKRCSITAGVPASTAQRWIKVLEEKRLVERRKNPDDGRSAYVELSSHAAELVAAWIRDIIHTIPT